MVPAGATADVLQAMRALNPEDVVRGRYAGYRKEALVARDSDVARSARVKRAGKDFLGDQRELHLMDQQPEEIAPDERLPGDAMTGNGALFTAEDGLEAAWTAIDPVPVKHRRRQPYRRGSWGPPDAVARIAADGFRHNPTLANDASD